MTLFSVLFQKDFDVVHNHIDAFCFFLPQQDFHTFHKLFSEDFCFFLFDNIMLTNLCIRKTITKKCCIDFLYTLKNYDFMNILLSHISYISDISYTSDTNYISYITHINYIIHISHMTSELLKIT